MDNGSSQGDQTVTVLGDALAFGGAVFVVGYIVVGRVLRTWMPIFLYAFPGHAHWGVASASRFDAS